jgi:hypothetical protein
MLGQMICIDRRYQRMNCFNVREYESLLKRKFFYDLLNSSDYRLLINKTSLNLRYKLNETNLNTHSSHLFGLFGLKKNFTLKQNFFVNLFLNNSNTANIKYNSLYVMDFFNSTVNFNMLGVFYYLSMVNNLIFNNFTFVDLQVLYHNFINNYINNFDLSIFIRLLFSNNIFYTFFEALDKCGLNIYMVNFDFFIFIRLLFSNNIFYTFFEAFHSPLLNQNIYLNFDVNKYAKLYFLYSAYNIIANIFNCFFFYFFLFLNNLTFLLNTNFFVYKSYNNNITNQEYSSNNKNTFKINHFQMNTNNYIYSPYYIVNMFYELVL